MMTLKDSDAAKISDLVYVNPIEGEYNKGYKTDYKFLESSANKDSAEGFFGAAFAKDNNIVIAFRGTNSPFSDLNGESIIKRLKQAGRDLEDDWSFLSNRWGISHQPMPQYQEALDFAKSIQQKYGLEKEIIITGHSLGGGMAQLVGIEFGYKVVSFDSPGTLSIARNIFSQDKIDTNKSLITAYVTGPNLFNTAGKQIVDPIQISVKTSAYNFAEACVFDQMGAKISNVIEFKYFEYSIEQHNSYNIFEAFSPNSGLPFSIVNYDKWPTWYEAYEQFNSHCILENDPKESDNKYPDVFEVLDMFSDPAVRDPALTNSDRFRLLAKQQEGGKYSELSGMFENLAAQTDFVLSFLGNSETVAQDQEEK